MRALVAFENVVYKKRPERKFFAYCRRRQPSLWRFVPGNFAADLAYFLHLSGRARYLERRWRFLSSVHTPEKRLKDFFAKQKLCFPTPEVEVVSDQPRQVLEAACAAHTLHANEFDAQIGRFSDYRSERELAGDAPYAAYGTPRAPLMQSAEKKIYVCGRKMTEDLRKYRRCVVGRVVLTHLLLLAYALLLSFLSLYYASRGASEPSALLRSYLSSPSVLLLNAAPVVWLMFLLYYLFSSAGAAALGTSALTLIMTWVNYFKLFFRGDPFLFEELQLVREAGAMTGSYAITLTPDMWLIAGAAAAVSVLLFFRKSRFRPQTRAVTVLALLVFAAVGYRMVYLSDSVYDGTYRPLTFQSYWSTSDQFQNRGFIYPFLHSTGSAFDRAPDGYNAERAESTLSQYIYEDIPEDRKVNVIACMLESYSDLTRFDELTFTEDPYEFFHALEKESYSGSALSYAFAGGTNTPERQFLTGLTQLPSFSRKTNSYAWYFRQQGYTVEGSHPYYSWFYDRDKINPRLGFEHYYFDEDSYQALNDGEQMSPDSVLLPEVVRKFENAAARGEWYFSFNVTFQGHGPYSDQQEYDHPFVENPGYSDETIHYLNNYLAIIDDVDDALADMVASLRESEAPVVLILFGDHMPGLGDRESAYAEAEINFDLATDEGFYNYYSTPYVIWANDAAKRVLGNDFVGNGPTVGTNFLMNLFFEQAGYTGNAYMRYTTQLMHEMQDIHFTGIVVQDGQVCRELTPEQQTIVDEFYDVQYYWRRNFNNR